MGTIQILLFYEFALFLVFIPIIFKAFMAFDLDRFFLKGYVWQKQVIYLSFVLITAKLLSSVFVDLIRIFLYLGL